MPLDVPVHPHDARMSKPVNGPRLLQEAIKAPGEVAGAPGRRHHPRAVRPYGDFSGEVLLDGHVSLEIVVDREIGDAEAARAEHANDLVLVDPKALWQRVHDSDSTSGDRC